MGKTNSAVAKLLSVMDELGSLPEASSVGCSSRGPVISLEADGEGGLGSTLPKQPSNNLVKEEGSVLARATLISLRPSHFSGAALPSRCAASSKSITPYVKKMVWDLKIMIKRHCSYKVNSNKEKN